MKFSSCLEKCKECKSLFLWNKDLSKKMKETEEFILLETDDEKREHLKEKKLMLQNKIDRNKEDMFKLFVEITLFKKRKKTVGVKNTEKKPERVQKNKIQKIIICNKLQMRYLKKQRRF